ncbi:MAG TPA: hypothetical protein VF484_01340 [Candidatus Limnocylindrales bacterium]
MVVRRVLASIAAVMLLVAACSPRANGPTQLAAATDTPAPSPVATAGPPFGGGRIYWSNPDPVVEAVFSANPDGTGVRQEPFKPGDLDPVWSRDHTQVAVIRATNPIWTLWVMGADASNPRKVATFAGASAQGQSWSPDGTQIAVIAISLQGGTGPTAELPTDVADIGASGLLVVDLPTGSVRTISANAAGDRTAWSPDGSRIVFGSRDGGLWGIRPDGTGYARITNGDDTFATWSPDGQWLAFQRQIDNPAVEVDHDLGIVRGDGTGLRMITSGAPDDEAPVWSPDGTAMAFARFMKGVQPDIFVLSPDGSLQNITNTPKVSETSPDWH